MGLSEIYEAKTRGDKMRLAKLAIFLLVVVLALAGRYVFAHAEEGGFSKEVQEALQRKIALIKETLSGDPLIIETVKQSNEKNKDISLEEIIRLDESWKTTEDIDEFIKQFITNECAERLIEFQETHDGYPEIFIADRWGLIVAETNKTSDYYQADEDWWVEGYNQGQGKSFYGEIEYDESAMSEAIAIYIPVIDPDTTKAIGVMKVIVDITAIKMEL